MNPTHSNRLKFVAEKFIDNKTDDEIVEEIKKLNWTDFNEQITRNQIKELRSFQSKVEKLLQRKEEPIPWSHLLDGIVIEVFEDGTVEGYDTSMNQKEVDAQIQKKFDDYLEKLGLVLYRP